MASTGRWGGAETLSFALTHTLTLALTRALALTLDTHLSILFLLRLPPHVPRVIRCGDDLAVLEEEATHDEGRLMGLD